MGIRKIDIEAVVRAFEADADEVLPDLRQALKEAKEGVGRVTTPGRILESWCARRGRRPG